MITQDDPVRAGCAADSSPLHAELRDLYAELDAAVARRAPVCLISGRCCRFEEYGHTLFLSAVEADYLVSLAPKPDRLLDEGRTCPWQDDHSRCTARDARPLGCRVFFCDPAYQDAAPELSEEFLARIKRLAARHDRPWDYAPLHRHLQDRFMPGHVEQRAEPANPS
jgi:hypothetical protein